MQFHNIDQNTDEWLYLRMGKLTGSGCSSMMASPNVYKVFMVEKGVYAIGNFKSKKILKQRFKTEIEAHNSLVERDRKGMANRFTDYANKAAITMAIEQVTGRRQESSYSNSHMERGHDQEPIARGMYEDRYFIDVDNGGFFDCGKSGCSPDGLVGDDGVIEIKSVIASVHYATVKRGGFDPAYKWQLYFNLLKTGRDWIDFVSYCAEFPQGKQLYVHRTHKVDCEEQFKMIAEREEMFFNLVDEIKDVIGEI